MRPNILFILTDDQAPWTLSAEGHPNAFTPELDRLAAEGARFTRLFANAAVCSPSRAAIVSGRYPSETGVAPDGVIMHIQKDSPHGLAAGIATWPAALRDAGYRTALVGKWHLGFSKEEYHPLRHGYERFSGWIHNSGVSRDPVMMVEGEEKAFKGEYTSDVLADLTMGYVREFGDDPWAISLHFWAPHANQRVPEYFVLPYKDRTWLPMKDEDLAPWLERGLSVPNPEFPNLDLPRIARMTREYHASVHSVDRNVGRIMAFLESAGIAENTVVVFTSDQGYNMAHHGLWHKGNGWWITTDRKDPDGVYGKLRNNLFDNSIRVPGIVRWPGVVRPGTVIEEMASFVDWFPTLLDMAGAVPPEGAVLRGRSIAPLLRGEGEAQERAVFSQHNTLRSWRDAEWKLVMDFSERKLDELYHVWEDPYEKTNLIGEASPIIQAERSRLEKLIRQRMAEIGDPLQSARP